MKIAAVLIIAFSMFSAICGNAGSSFLQATSAQSRLMNPKDPTWSTKAPAVFRAKFESTKGNFIVEAHRDWAPLGVDRLYNLVRTGFFDNSRFYRIHAGYIAQFGIPGDPKVAGVWRDQSFPDDPVKQTNLRGFVAYAMTGLDTRTTQIYINLIDNKQLDGQGFAPIGKVVEGMDVVDHLYSEYGENSGGGMRAGKQAKMFEEGNAYLDREFPKLDKLIKATILPESK